MLNFNLGLHIPGGNDDSLAPNKFYYIMGSTKMCDIFAVNMLLNCNPLIS